MVDRQQVEQGVVAVAAVAQDQAPSGAAAMPAEQLVGVGRELQQRLDLGVAGQLGVVDRVRLAVSPGPDEEVGPTVEAAVEERALEHHVRAGLQRRNGFGMLGPQVARQCLRVSAIVHHAGAELLAELLQHPVFVHVAQRGGPLEHRVPAESGTVGAAQPHIQHSQRWYSQSAAGTRSVAV